MIMLFAIALTGLSLTACSEDDLDTNQYSKGVSLSAYGPQPVMRGGTLRFLGSNLDQIAQIIIPGMEDSPITNFEVVQAGVPSEIRVVLPKDGPEVGYVTLITKTDEKITTATKLTYEEPIEITGFTPASVMPGEEITIEGDYLNLVQMVQFANDDENVYVGQDDFVEHTRYKIVVKVPETARTGKLNLYTLDLTKEENSSTDLTYNIMETEDALTVGTPTVTKLASPRGEAEAQGAITAKLGETITITGEHFNLVDAVSFSAVDEDGAVVSVVTDDFVVSEDGKTLTLALPADAPDGDINLVARSGVEIPVGTLTTVAPSECVAAPSPVKAGAALTITGKDLDVVSTVEMLKIAGSDGTQETITPIEFTVNDDGTQLVITAVPDEAVEGNLTLRMANGKGVEVAFTLVKPAVTSYSSASVSAGGALTLNGTDLDLVSSVSFGDASVASDAFTSQSETAITLTVPMEATSGKPTLTLKNGTTVEAPELAVEEAVFCYVVAFPDEENTPEAGGTMTVEVKNGDKLTNVYVNGEEVKFVYDSKNSKLTVGIPQKAKATSTLKLVSSNGEIEYDFSVIPAGLVTTVIWTGPVDLNSWGNTIELPANSFTDVDENSTVTLRIDYTPTEGEIKTKWYGGHWNNIAMPGSEGDENIVTFDANATSIDLVLTSEQLANLQEYNNWGYCGLFHGQGAIINKVSMIVKTSLETTIWSGEQDLGSWSVNYEINDGNGNANLFAGACKAGTILRVYVDAYNDWSQIQLFDGHWSGLNFANNGSSNNFNSGMSQWAEHPTYYEVTLTADEAERLNTLYDWGYCLIVQGENCTLKKVTIE